MNGGEATGLVEVTNPDQEIGGHNGKLVQEFAVETAPIIAVSGKRHHDWQETTPVEDCINNEKKTIDAIDMKFGDADDRQIQDASSSVAPNATCTNGQGTITRLREEEEELNGSSNGNAEQWSPTHRNRALLSQAWKLDFPSTKKKLLILDVNGLLVARYAKIDRDIIPTGAPYGVVSRSYMFKRPFCDSFLTFCFENFDVGFWSSMRETNVVRALDFICQGMRASCRFVMHQGDCTITGLQNPEKHSQPLFLKELVKVWSKFPQFNESNSLLVDDTPYKALRNPPYTAIFPEAYFYNEADTFLKGPLVEYLTQLRDAEDVREFVRTHPIGMPAIAPGCLYWDVYQQVLETRTENVSPLSGHPPVATVPQTSRSGWDRVGRAEELGQGAFPHDAYRREARTQNVSPFYSHPQGAKVPQMSRSSWDHISPLYTHPPVAMAPQTSRSGWDRVSPFYGHPPAAMVPQPPRSGWDHAGRAEEFREGAIPQDVYQRVLEARMQNVSPFYSHYPVAMVPQTSHSGWDRVGRAEELREGALHHDVYQREERTQNVSPFYSHPPAAMVPQTSRSGWDRVGKGKRSEKEHSLTNGRRT